MTSVDLTEVMRGLDGVRRRVGNLHPVWRIMRKEIHASIREQFANAEGPAGAWPSWARSTQEKFLGRRGNTIRRGKKRGMLTRRGERRLSNILGRLKSALLFRATKATLIVTSKVPWAFAHQHGATVGRGSRLPARPLGLMQGVATLFRDTLLEYVRRGFFEW